ncbi:MAG: hydroxyphenylacetyl-CoA thioesterase PaaI [Actinomycetota bacterium]|nr:hydroxyphenylacetyl-CoA thioesterase PaaI [Actinomycetota bacterium]
MAAGGDQGPGAGGTALAEEMFAADRASAGLGMRLEQVGDGGAVVSMTVLPSMVNGHRIGHGGYVFMLADSAFACACNSRGEVTVAAGADISFVAQVREGDVLVATAAERVSFGRNGIYDVTVRRGDEIVAEFRGRSRTVGRSRAVGRPGVREAGGGPGSGGAPDAGTGPGAVPG